MKVQHHKAARAALLTTCAFFALSLSSVSAGYADDASEVIALDRQSLASAIEHVSRTFGRVVAAPGVDADRVMVNAVNEHSTIVSALNTGLAGSGLEAVESASGAIIIQTREDRTPTERTPAERAQAPARTTLDGQAEEDPEIDRIVITGSNIRGAALRGVLPLTQLDAEALEMSGVVDGIELLRALPQNGDVNFNEANETGGINTARGDVASINLRSAGTGNTLVLINGRRMVLHPGFQNENGVPVVTPNINAIPVAGVDRVEVLRDGASAVYGADAVAGVLNTQLVGDYEGLSVSGRYGYGPSTEREDILFTLRTGSEFANGRGHFSAFADYNRRNPVPTANLAQASSSNRVPLLEGTDFEGVTAFDNRSSRGAFGYFDIVEPGALFSLEGDRLSNGSGRFHLQPAGRDGCLFDIGNDLCIDDGFFSRSQDADFYHDIDAVRELYGERHRANFASNFTYQLNAQHEVYGEASVYHARSKREFEASRVLSTARIIIPADNYWNPLGPVRFDDGRLNPNRVAGLDIPEEGLALQLRDYRLVDTGPRIARVENTTYRFLLGARGVLGNWDYDTAVLHSEAETRDKLSNTVSSTLFREALSLDTPDAYNPFNGAGPIVGTHVVDSTPNPQNVIDGILVDIAKTGETALTLADFRLSNSRLLSLPAGDLGASFGVEARHESFSDDQDPRSDGTIPFFDPLSGVTSLSDALGNSPTLDSSGDRDIFSAFGELIVPVVSADMNIPLVQDIRLQVAGRYENFSDVGDVFVPRVAGSWSINDSIMIRAAYSEGFRAPNLVQVNAEGVSRINGTIKYVECAALLATGQLQGDFSNCEGVSLENVRDGGDLEPEDSININVGAVFTPSFLDNLLITVDYWEIEQDGVVGVLSGSNQVGVDLLLRQQGSFNPNVIREAPTPEQIALYESAGILPAGDLIRVLDPYFNLDTRTIRGVDFSLDYSWDTEIGDFTFHTNVAHLLELSQAPSGLAAELFDLGLPVSNLGRLEGINGYPTWRANARLTWRDGPYRLGASYEYVSAFDETSASITVDGERRFWEVEAWDRLNLFASVSLDTFEDSRSTLSVGVRNVFDNEAPLADERYGHFGKVHSAVGRYVYVNLRHTF